ncbi:MAG: chromate resistance protein ChrB domain-containing protein [Gemmatimonadota bacterium]
MVLTERHGGPWLLFIHQLPAKPGYARVRLWRRLQRIGAVQVKSSVWGLPVTNESLEDFQWLAEEVQGADGEALICQATFVAGLTDEVSEALLAAAGSAPQPESRASAPKPGSARSFDPMDFRGRVWVTRRGAKADRIGSAWLIKRFVDSDATFKFVSETGYVPSAGEIRFDMYEAEFSHQGDACTFEVLASTFVSVDRAVAAIGEIVHDIDLKESRFARPETEGIRLLLLDGVCREAVADERRLELGFALFDVLWNALNGRAHSFGSLGGDAQREADGDPRSAPGAGGMDP